MKRYCYQKVGESEDTPAYCFYCQGVRFQGKGFVVCKLAKDKPITIPKSDVSDAIIAPSWCPLDQLFIEEES